MTKIILTLSLTLWTLAAPSPARAEIGGFTLGSTTLTGDNLIISNTGNITVGTSNNVARMSDDGTIRFWAGHATAGSAPFRVEQDGDVFVDSLNASGGSISGTSVSVAGGDVVLNSSGITLQAGGSSENRLKWSDGSYIISNSDAMSVSAADNILLEVSGDGVFVTTSELKPVTNGGMNLGTTSQEWNNFYTNDARVSSLSGTGTRHVCADDDGDLMICP